MGDYIVNGEVVPINKTNPTASDLKQASGAQPSDWVMSSGPDGKMVQIADGQALPSSANDFSVVPSFHYGK